jgi:hypothetical protein
MDYRATIAIAKKQVRALQNNIIRHRLENKRIRRARRSELRGRGLLVIQPMTRRRMAKFVHRTILMLADIEKNAGAAKLYQLWKMYKSGLWMEFSPTNVEGKTLEYSFMGYVEDHLSDALSAGYQTDMGRICAELFQRVTDTKFVLPSGELVTPELLIERGGMARMKKAMQKLRVASTDQQDAPPEVVQACILGVVTQKDLTWFDDVMGKVTRGNLPVLLPITEYRLNQDGSWDAVTRCMSQQQYELHKSLIQNYSEGEAFA